MGIALFVRILMMDPVRCHPGDGPAFECHSSADRHPVFEPPRRFVSAMRQQPVITHPDSHAAGEPPKKYRDRKILPAKGAQGGNGGNVEKQHEKRGGLVQWLLKRSICFENTHSPGVLTRYI